MLFSILIPVKNEEDNVQKIIENFKDFKLDYELLFIDDFSNDNTHNNLLNLKKNNDKIKIIKNDKPGLGSAINAGIKNSSGEYVCIMMCDGSDSIKDLNKYAELIKEKNIDAVFGSRFLKESKILNYPFKKLILNRIFNYIVSILFMSKYNDYTNAFKIYKIDSIKKTLPLVSESFNIFLEIPLKIISRKMKYEVIAIDWTSRSMGASKFKIKELGSRYIFTLLYCWLEKTLLMK